MWDNQDTVPHTATSGTGPSDPDSAKLFDTSIINGGESSTPVEITDAKEGDAIPYHCTIHPFMTGEITIAAREQAVLVAPVINQEEELLLAELH